MLRKLSHPSNRHIFSQIECLLTRSTSADLKVIARLRIKDLISSLYMAAHEINLTKNQGHIDEISKTLRNLRANLQRRKKASDPLTSSRLMEIPEPARAILLSDIAYTFRDEIDDYTQIATISTGPRAKRLSTNSQNATKHSVKSNRLATNC